jgi:hypothetical protein
VKFLRVVGHPPRPGTIYNVLSDDEEICYGWVAKRAIPKGRGRRGTHPRWFYVHGYEGYTSDQPWYGFGTRKQAAQKLVLLHFDHAPAKPHIDVIEQELLGLPGEPCD